MKVIAVANQKGGVGKTTTAVNLSATFVNANKKPLLIDLDAQANATTWLLGKYGQDGKVIYDVMLRKADILDCIQKGAGGVEIVPSNLSLATLDLDLNNELNREHRLAVALRSVRDKYDYVLIDCPPNLGMSTLNAFTAANIILIPVECKAEAFEALPRLMGIIRRLITEFEISPVIYSLPTFLERTNLAREIHNALKQKFESLCLPAIHKNTRLAEAFQNRQTIFEYDPVASGAIDYTRIAKELLIDHGQEKETRRRRTSKRK